MTASWQLTCNQDDAIYRIDLEFDDDLRSLTCTVMADDQPVATLRISTEEKTAIEPLDREDAIPVDINLIMELMTPKPVETDVIIEDAEDVVES